jgi:hypothetical protein
MSRAENSLDWDMMDSLVGYDFDQVVGLEGLHVHGVHVDGAAWAYLFEHDASEDELVGQV